MSSINIMDHITTSVNSVDAYNDNVAEAHYQALHGVNAWEGQSKRPLMSDYLSVFADLDATNDNQRTPVQADLFA